MSQKLPRFALLVSLALGACSSPSGVSSSGSVIEPEPLVTTAAATATSADGVAGKPGPAPSVSGPLVFGKGEVLVRGTITREKRPTTANDDFVAGPDATMSISLRRYEGEDAPAPLVIGESVALPKGVLSFPIAYEIRGDQSKLGDRGSLLLSAKLDRGGSSSGPKTMMSEYRNQLHAGGGTLDFNVSGVEPCGSPGAGGFCE